MATRTIRSTPDESAQIRVREINSPRSWAITDNPHANYPRWLGHSEQLIWLEAMDNGYTRFVVRDARLRSAHYVVGTVSGPVQNLKVGSIAFREDCDDDLSFAVVGQANPDGTLFNPTDRTHVPFPSQPQNTVPGQSAHRPKNVIWFGELVRPSQTPEGQYTMTPMTNLMEYFKLGDIELDGSIDEDSLDFFKDTYHIAFVAKDLESDPSTHTNSSCYLCLMMGWAGSPPTDEYYHAWRYRGLGGTICSPAINAGGTVALLCKKEDGYAADKNRIVLVTNFQTGESREIFASADGKGQWNLSPSAISFASTESLLIQVNQDGRQVLYQLNLKSWPNQPTPADLKLFDGLIPFGSVLDVTTLPGKAEQVLVSCDSFVHSRQLIIQDLPAQVSRPLLPSALGQETFGLTERQVDQIWFLGDEQRQIHAWVIRPSYFNPKQKYPLLYIIHDGPQDSWRQSWDMRYHLALFAEHGYIVVAPNPTGSTGYGHEFTDAVHGSWAGKPYSDLENGFDYICQSLEYVDTERAVALGLGYGGYMVNWIQGHNLGRRFKAVISDNGTFNLLSHLASSTQHSILHGLGGPPWLNPEEWRKWDPAQHAGNWKTPQLIIHGEFNHQHPVSEALAAFNTLNLHVVRKALGYKMIGDSSDAVWGVMDMVPRTNFPDIRKKSTLRSKAGNILIIPREGENINLTRFYIELAPGINPKDVTLESLQEQAQAIFHPYKVDFAETVWWSAYSIGQRQADCFHRDHRVFLAGDACHTHSPKAGQGMNVSLQDGYNIGWKLGEVLTGLATPSLLETYVLER
ncbi:acylamino-acid-releasing enzyme [Penicillium atrosanguineum]|nr:acylamino-acid-releasing enzyme [Penicillium atrosanguineum]